MLLYIYKHFYGHPIQPYLADSFPKGSSHGAGFKRMEIVEASDDEEGQPLDLYHQSTARCRINSWTQPKYRTEPCHFCAIVLCGECGARGLFSGLIWSINSTWVGMCAKENCNTQANLPKCILWGMCQYHERSMGSIFAWIWSWLCFLGGSAVAKTPSLNVLWRGGAGDMTLLPLPSDWLFSVWSFIA